MVRHTARVSGAPPATDRERSRRAARAYGLFERASAESDSELRRLAEWARTLCGADGAAIHLTDGGAQSVIVAHSASIGPISGRRAPPGDPVSGSAVNSAVVAVIDAAERAAGEVDRWDTERQPEVRFYAAAPLVTLDGVALGTVCVWSSSPAVDGYAQAARLAEARDAVMINLQARRAARAPVSDEDEDEDEASPRITGPAAAAPAVWSIATVIDDLAVQTMFQPIVRLDSGEIVGFEALSRGPAATSLESPLALLEAARLAGRLGELDWVCRIQALRAAAASGLPSSLSWFINVEPAGLAVECPEYLRPALSTASSELRVVLEVVERDVEGSVVNLLRATDQARRDAWGVALDDVGAEEGSLALLPFLQPDVVKLDMSLIRDVPDRATAAITAAVRAYAARCGAVILAEGIETEEQEALAAVLGATYGQGYRYGRPGHLPAAVAMPREPVPLQQRPQTSRGRTPFEVLSALENRQTASKRLLLHISGHLELKAGSNAEACVMLACFQRSTFFTAGKRRLYERLSVDNALTVVVAEGVEAIDQPRFRVAALAPGGRMCREWQLIVISPDYAAAFVARDLGDAGPDADRRFEFVYTHNRDAVVAAGRSYLEQLGVECPPGARP